MKISVVVVLIVGALYDVSANNITDLMKKYNIPHDLGIDYCKHKLVVVSYIGHGVVDPFRKDRLILQNWDTSGRPSSLTWPHDDNKFYTFMHIGLDYAPYGTKYQLIKWLQVNVPGNRVGRGEVLVQYIGDSRNAFSSEPDIRNVFLVYEQEGPEKFNEKLITEDELKPRKFFSAKKFAAKYNMLPQPAACTFYLTKY